MTVILVLFTFTAFLLIDHFYSRNNVVVHPAAHAARHLSATPISPSLVSGFKVPENLRYHPGHTWALSESPNLVRVGMDDFASKLTGKLESITLPLRGQWIRQGQKVCTLHRNGVAVDMVSPIEGSVSDINQALADNPNLANSDPYGEGWLITVQSPDAKTNFRNLLGGALARWWTEESATRLHRKMPTLSGLMPASAMAQDGGVAINNVGSEVADKEWSELTKEFFLS